MYSGGIISLITFPLWDPHLSSTLTFVLGCISLLPGGIDGTTQMFGERESTNRLRVLTGLLLGIGIAFIARSVSGFAFA